jgi:hypothetical protein
MKIGKKHKTMSRSILGIVLFSSLTGFSASCQKQEKSAGPKEKVTIGVGPGGLSLPRLLIGASFED